MSAKAKQRTDFLLHVVGFRKWWYLVSVLLIIPGSISLALYGIKAGIDFTGGSLLEVKLSKQLTSEQVKQAVGATYGEPIVQTTSDDAYQIRLKEVTPAQQNEIVAKLQQVDGGKVEIRRAEIVGPTISKDITSKAGLSVGFGSLLIVLYIAYAFRAVPKPASSFRFGVTTIITLLHDILFILGVFSLLGHFFGIEVDASFVAAVLTVIGFSVHDTIVVFDRIRENLMRGHGSTLEGAVNFSIAQTIVRSINTSVTVLLVLSAMYLFGGVSISNFILALLIGVVIGTYSSIFNAAPVLVTWQAWSDKRAAAKRAKA